MNKLKKLLGAGLAIGLLALSVLFPMKAAAEARNSHPASNVGYHQRLDFYGLKAKRVVASATATALVVGPGFLDAICTFGGTLGKYSMAFDTIGGSGVGDNSGNTDFPSSSHQYAISPKVYTTNDTTSSQHGQLGCWVPPAPIKFIAGLYGDADSAGHTTLYFVHCSDGDNPCEL